MSEKRWQRRYVMNTRSSLIGFGEMISGAERVHGEKNHFYKPNRVQMYYIISNKTNTKKDEAQSYEEIK